MRQFEARVVARDDTGGRYRVALDQSAFYPEGGGQPCDYGAINGVEVLDVQAEDGVVWHTLAAPLSDGDVSGAIDWPRRFDHMQQHHGQHLLSAAFERLFGLRTVSFHLSPGSVTIDLASATLTPEQALAAEDLANAVIWENRPIAARFVSAEELAGLTLRKQPTVSGPIRVVSVPDFDDSACGGTHPSATGAVGIVSIRRWERRGETTRLEFACGARAARELRERSAIATRAAAGLSVGIADLEQALQRLRASDDLQRRALADARQELLAYQAQEWVASAKQQDGAPIVHLTSDTLSLDEARTLARLISERGATAIIGLTSGKGQVLAARGAGSSIDIAGMLRAALAPLGGRGGGRPEAAQGGLPDTAQVAAAVADVVRQIQQAHS
jgi:alanyl-tRNA synthetase